MDWLPLVTQILTPMLGSLGGLVSDLVSGRTSLDVAKSELRGILSVATNRLDDADKAFAARDGLQDARIRKPDPK